MKSYQHHTGFSRRLFKIILLKSNNSFYNNKLIILTDCRQNAMIMFYEEISLCWKLYHVMFKLSMLVSMQVNIRKIIFQLSKKPAMPQQNYDEMELQLCSTMLKKNPYIKLPLYTGQKH